MSGCIIVYEVATIRDNQALVWNVEIDFDQDRDLGLDLLALLDQRLAEEDWQLMKILSIKIEKKCWGCRNRAPGQRSHMDEGGCFYEGSE